MPVCGSGVMFGASEQPERRFDVAAAGELVTAARQRVTRGAIAGDGEIAAALDLFEILFVDALADGSTGGDRRTA